MIPINNEWDKVAKSEGLMINTYTALLEQISSLSYDNPKYVLYYRGQGADFQTAFNRSTLYPKIYRGKVEKNELKERFRLLDNASETLFEVSKKYKLKGISEMRKKKQILWSILQHYEICDTPFLDVTHSLRTACTFALNNAKIYGYLYVLAMPYLTNRITYNSEEDITLVRLLSISPPDAKRPFYQEAYVVGTPDIRDNFEEKGELDLANRLVGKFRIVNSDLFWGQGFSPLRDEFIYPKDDIFMKIKKEVIELRKRGFYEDSIGDFLLLWNELDGFLKESSGSNQYEPISSSFKKYVNQHSDKNKIAKEFKFVKDFRNELVHGTKRADEEEISRHIQMLKSIRNSIE